MGNKAALIAKATKNIAHNRTDAGHKEIKTESISFKIGDSKSLLETFKPNSRSAAIRAALSYADVDGVLDEFKI